ncbi:MAG: hypothetical protein GY765_14340 [bacterium]|nr:hypothetical protein [bacterium]
MRRKLSEIEELAKSVKVRPRHIPMGVYIQEAKDLYHWSQADKEELADVGLSMELLEDIPLRVEALVEAQSAWQALRNQNAKREHWRIILAEGLKARSDMITIYHYAFRNNKDLLKKLKKHTKETYIAALLQSFYALYYMGKENISLLEKIAGAVAKAESMLQWALDFKDSHTHAFWSKATQIKLRNRRDAAYLHLKEAVDEVRLAGKFACRHKETRLVGYRSSHLRQGNTRRRSNAKKQTATGGEATGAPGAAISGEGASSSKVPQALPPVGGKSGPATKKKASGKKKAKTSRTAKGKKKNTKNEANKAKVDAPAVVRQFNREAPPP